ncbi:GntR family transcriptional regulator [Spiractinospora alimapuensis]|uniref:GntR family transcriptional regulator n=1 Tax=Spiractinospora alimapuensis TaxID=2820884 RepID=UPI001F18604E|nr:GntR family transcriptional regulator [Spiractinospora alimapuensis]QVQ53044.1 GntR family transcriptional regulator [Spiractinospora alimapuensis]
MSDANEGLPTLTFQGSRSQVVADSIRKAILSGKLAPGQPLVERELSQQFGVSKTPVREALIGLVGSGLVDQHHYRGMTVQRVSPELARDVFETRDRLEPYAIGLAAHRVDDADVSEAQTVLDRAGEHGRRGAWIDMQLLNRSFHRRLYGACGNPVMCRYLDGLQDLVALISLSGWTQRTTWEQEHAEHQRILDAVAARDAAAAEAEARAHMNGFVTQLMDSLAAEDRGPTNTT